MPKARVWENAKNLGSFKLVWIPERPEDRESNLQPRCSPKGKKRALDDSRIDQWSQHSLHGPDLQHPHDYRHRATSLRASAWAAESHSHYIASLGRRHLNGILAVVASIKLKLNLLHHFAAWERQRDWKVDQRDRLCKRSQEADRKAGSALRANSEEVFRGGRERLWGQYTSARRMREECPRAEQRALKINWVTKPGAKRAWCSPREARRLWKSRAETERGNQGPKGAESAR